MSRKRKDLNSRHVALPPPSLEAKQRDLLAALDDGAVSAHKLEQENEHDSHSDVDSENENDGGPVKRLKSAADVVAVEPPAERPPLTTVNAN